MICRRAVAVLILSLGTLSLAQFPDFSDKSLWVHFTPSSGLPSGEVTSIFESSDSTLWVSTLTGVAWFDGYRWRQGEKGSIWPANAAIIRSEYRDSILIFSSGIYYLGNKNGFRELFKRVGTNLFMVGNDSIPLSGEAALYALFGESTVPKPDLKLIQGITQVYSTKNGNIWLTFPDGLYRRQGKSWNVKLRSPSFQERLVVLSVTENNHGSGICLVRGPAEKIGIWEWTHNGPLRQSKLAKPVLYIVSADIDENDNVVAVAQAGEIFVRHGGRWNMLPFLPENASSITSVLFRRNGDLCLGSDDGLRVWRLALSIWTSLPSSSLELKNCINEIFKTHNGDLWIASANGIEIKHAKGKTEDITFIGSERILNVTGLQEDDAGNMWISSGSSFNGAYRWDGKTWKHFPVTGYPGGIYIHKIRKDRQGRLWFLGLGHNLVTSDDIEAGANVLDHDVFSRWSVPEGLLSGRVYAFDQSSDGTLWFGTHKGLSRYQSGVWTHWTSANGLRRDHVFCLAIDHDGNVWFGHMTTLGLGRISRDGSLRYFSTEDGLPDNRIYDIKVDSSGVVWVTTRGGLCCYDHGRWFTFDEKTGLVSNALWPVFPSSEGVYVGTTGKGMAVLHLAGVTEHYPFLVIDDPLVDHQNAFVRWQSYAYYGEVPPENSLTRYRLNGESWSAWNTSHEMSVRSSAPGFYTIEVQAKGLYGQFDPVSKRASFTILPPLYFRPIIYLPAAGAIMALASLLVMIQLRRIKHRKELEESEERYRLVTELMSDYAYLLRIEDDDTITVLWITESFTRLTGYSTEEFKRPDFIGRFSHPEDIPSMRKMFDSVKSGKPESYESRIYAKNGHLLWINHHVAPIWDGAHTRVANIYGIARDITQRKHNEEQMKMLATELSLTEERERRRMATFLHDTIGQSLAFSKIKLRSLERSIRDENILSALSEIRSLVEESINDTRSLTFELSPPSLHELGVVEAIRSLATQLFERHNIGIEFAGDQLPLQPADEISIILYYAVREVLINIVKHSGASWVSLSVSSSAGSIHVTVRDNGVGMKTITEEEGRERKDSFGLFNTRERIAHLGGSLEISSVPNEGTTIVLTIPLNTPTPEPPAPAMQKDKE
jgi:PAS domain S-box-containing protein